MNPLTRFAVPNPPIASESFGDEAVLVNLEKGTYYSVRGSALTIWSLVSAGIAVGAIVDTLAATYDAPKSDIDGAVTALIGELAREGLIVPAREDALLPEVASAAPQAKQPFEPPVLEKFTDVQELLALDPIHDVDGTGWPQPRPDRTPGEPAPSDDEDPE